MPRPTKRSKIMKRVAADRIAAECARTDDNTHIAPTSTTTPTPSTSSIFSTADDFVFGHDLLYEFDMDEDDFGPEMVEAFSALQPFDNTIKTHIREAYTGNSRWTERRNRLKQEQRAATMIGSKSLTSYFSPVPQNSDNHADDDNDEDDQGHQIDLPKIIDLDDMGGLNVTFQGLWEAIKDFGPSVDKKELARHVRYTAAKNYIDTLLRHPGVTAVEASKQVAKMTYQGRTLSSDQRRRANAIRSWAEEFVADGVISTGQQGKHMKTISILGSEDMKLECTEWLKKKKPMERDIYALKAMIDEKLTSVDSNENTNENENENGGVRVLTGRSTISKSTIARHLIQWGFCLRKNVKGIYFDGHERPDVVRYRQMWAAKMMSKSKSMIMYEGDNMEVEIWPTIRPGHKRHVLVTHDESVFYANDGNTKGWFLTGEVQLRGKGPGLSIMVSEFQCPCHGTMRHRGKVSRKLFEAGANREGYWSHQDVVKQLKEEVIPIFKALHPDCMGTFIFDQSSNHKAYATDALVASRMNRDPHKYVPGKPHFRPTTFRTEDGVVKAQNFYVMKDGGKRRRDGTVKLEKYFIGVKQILEERGLWHDRDRSPGREGKAWRLFCGDNNTINSEGNTECCARHCLANQPDFLYQLCALQETLKDQNLLCDFYPKFHCECNWIERYWADLKRYTRKHCDYSYKGLKLTLEDAFNEASPPNATPTKIRRYFMRCFRYIDAYSRNLDAESAEEDVCGIFKNTTHKSHRTLLTGQ